MNPKTLKSVPVTGEAHKLNRFDYSHEGTTTFDLGFVQPVLVRELEAGSSIDVAYNAFSRTTPLHVPSFARLRLNFTKRIVRMSDLTKRYAKMMIKQPLVFGPSNYIPTEVVNIDNRFLSCIALCGATCTPYYQTGSELAVEGIEGFGYTPIKSLSVDGDGYFSVDVEKTLEGVDYKISNLRFGAPDTEIRELGYQGEVFDLRCLFGTDRPFTDTSDVTLDNLQHPKKTVVPIHFSFYSPSGVSSTTLSKEQVPLESADIVIVRQFKLQQKFGDVDEVEEEGVVQPDEWIDSDKYIRIAFAFKLSNYGKHLKSILQGCGYRINFVDSYRVSLLPLCAYYKAYFDTYGLLRYINYELTACNKLLQQFEQSAVATADVDSSFWQQHTSVWAASNFWRFVAELADCWVTRGVDFVSAHTPTPVVSSDAQSTLPFNLRFGTAGVNEDNSSVVTLSSSSDDDNNTLQHILSSSNIGYAQLMYLKKLALSVNMDTQLGRDIAKLLRAHGQSKYVDELKSNFVGADECLYKILDVDCNTENDNAPLAKVAGKGIGSLNGRHHHYSCDEKCFLIVFASITPDSGYAQSLENHVRNYNLSTFYRPLFDGQAYELNDKLQVVADKSFNDVPVDGDDTLLAPLGFVPLMSRHKVKQNFRNGDFALRSVRANLDPYYLDKIIDVGEPYFAHATAGTGENAKELTYVMNGFLAKDLPSASLAYFYATKFEWLGQFSRIFNAPHDVFSNLSDVSLRNYEFFGTQEDNILVDISCDFIAQEPKLPIEDTFQTIDPDVGHGNMNVNKN